LERAETAPIGSFGRGISLPFNRTRLAAKNPRFESRFGYFSREKRIFGNIKTRIVELTIVPVAGHTRGSQVLLYKNRFLFTGDHPAWSPKRETLIAFRNACRYSRREQTRTMAKLLNYEFEWVLPGHGRIAHRPKAEMKRHLRGCIEWMKQTN